MSRYSYAGTFVNPTLGMFIRENSEGKYEIWIRSDREIDGSCKSDRKHNSAPTFDDSGEASEYLEDCAQFFEDDYDNYLDENSDELRRADEYENFKNEY